MHHILRYAVTRIANALDLLRVHRKWNKQFFARFLCSVDTALIVNLWADQFTVRTDECKYEEFTCVVRNLSTVPAVWRQCFKTVYFRTDGRTINELLAALIVRQTQMKYVVIAQRGVITLLNIEFTAFKDVVLFEEFDRILGHRTHSAPRTLTWDDVIRAQFSKLRTELFSMHSNTVVCDLHFHKDVKTVYLSAADVSFQKSHPDVQSFEWIVHNCTPLLDLRHVFPSLKNLALGGHVTKILRFCFGNFECLERIHIDIRLEQFLFGYEDMQLRMRALLENTSARLSNVRSFSGSGCAFPVFKKLLCPEKLKSIYLDYPYPEEGISAQEFQPFHELENLRLPVSIEAVQDFQRMLPNVKVVNHGPHRICVCDVDRMCCSCIECEFAYVFWNNKFKPRLYNKLKTLC
jgi:hypothetical protein